MIGQPTSPADWLVVAPVLLSLLGAALLLMLRRWLRLQSWICLAVTLAVLACDGFLFERVLGSGPLSMTMGRWLPPFGISFTADVMGAGFATLAAFVAFAVVLALMAAPEGPVRDGVHPLMLLFLAGVSGVLLTGDLFNLYVWFEVMLIASLGLFVLAGQPLQLDAAVKYAVPNVVATSLLLLALGLIYGMLGTLNMADIIGRSHGADPGLVTAVAAVFLLALGIKAAVFPIGAWLPASYHALPPPVSALVGGLSTKVGVYVALRFAVMLMPEARELLSPAISLLAMFTALAGPLSAIAEANPRRVVGFLLIGGVGVALLSLVETSGTAGGIFYLAHSMLTIAALYLITGLVDQAPASEPAPPERVQSRLGAIMFMLLVLAISGVPPFLGFWPKLLLLQAFLASGNFLLVFVLLLSSLLTLIAGIRLWSALFWRPEPRLEAGGRSLGAVVLLTGTVVLVGLAPNLMIRAATAAAQGMLDPSRYIAATGLSP